MHLAGRVSFVAVGGLIAGKAAGGHPSTVPLPMAIQDVMLLIAIVTIFIVSKVAGVCAMERRMKDSTLAFAVMGARQPSSSPVSRKVPAASAPNHAVKPASSRRRNCAVAA